jgi:hypothetical protein
MTFILENTECLNERAEVAFPGGSPAKTLSGPIRTADEPNFRSRASGKGTGRRRKEAINPHGSGSAAQQTQTMGLPIPGSTKTSAVFKGDGVIMSYKRLRRLALYLGICAIMGPVQY